MSRNTARYSRPLHQPGLYQRGTNRMKVLFKKTMKIFNSSYTFLYTPIRSKYIIKFDVNSALLRSSSVQSHSATDRLIIQHRRQHPRKARHMPFIFMLQQHPPHTTTKKCKKNQRPFMFAQLAHAGPSVPSPWISRNATACTIRADFSLKSVLVGTPIDICLEKYSLETVSNSL